MDHDQRFKNLLREFFDDYLRLFHAPWAERLETSAVEWLEQEMFADPPKGRRRVLDLVGRLPVRQAVRRRRKAEQWMALVHVEIESADRAATLRPRMFDAYVQLRRKYRLPVLPLALFLRTGLDGVGVDAYEERLWDLRPVRFEYLYVGLPALDAVKYLEGESLLGVALAALMRIPGSRIAWLGAEALRRIAEARLPEQKRFLLGECVQAYLPLDTKQRTEFERLLATPTYRKVRSMNTTWYETGEKRGFEKGQRQGFEKGQRQGFEKGQRQGFEKGQEHGLVHGRRQFLRDLLVQRFGPLTPKAAKRLEKMTAEQLRALGNAMFEAESLKDLGLSD